MISLGIAFATIEADFVATVFLLVLVRDKEEFEDGAEEHRGRKQERTARMERKVVECIAAKSRGDWVA